ncbi:phage/plasmid primase, P4 family, partial [Thermoproteota archaeon]
IHNKKDLDFIQEWFAYSLYTSYPIKAFLLCIGSGNNGKSIELNLIIEVIGEKNNTSVSLQFLNSNPYGVAELYNKLTNISDDISNRKIRSTGILKTVSDGGTITARRIRGSPFDFKPYAKITNSCNEPPEILDDSDAIWNRLKAVNYPYIFTDNPKEDNEKIKIDTEELQNSLREEYQGILNWMIQGLIRLRKNKFKFSYNLSTKEVRQYYLYKSKPVVTWIEDELEYTGDDEDIIIKDDIYNLGFKKWCIEKNLKPIPTRAQFFKALRDEQIDARQSREYDMKRVYFGYKCNRITGKDNVSTTINNKVHDNTDLNNKISRYPVTEKEEQKISYDDSRATINEKEQRVLRGISLKDSNSSTSSTPSAGLFNYENIENSNNKEYKKPAEADDSVDKEESYVSYEKREKLLKEKTGDSEL